MTGYPIVDAECATQQYWLMHNRVRMITASFLTKHLLIDWRSRDAYFASKLLDYEMASNVGGWQWASGSGCDVSFFAYSIHIRSNKNLIGILITLENGSQNLKPMDALDPLLNINMLEKGS